MPHSLAAICCLVLLPLSLLVIVLNLRGFSKQSESQQRVSLVAVLFEIVGIFSAIIYLVSCFRS